MAAKLVSITKGREIPPGHLGEAGRSLWASLRRDHEISDAAGLCLLARACEAQDRLAQVREQIARDGVVTRGYKGQPRGHPLLSVESDLVRVQLACLRQLGLEPEQ